MKKKICLYVKERKKRYRQLKTKDLNRNVIDSLIPIIPNLPTTLSFYNMHVVVYSRTLIPYNNYYLFTSHTRINLWSVVLCIKYYHYTYYYLIIRSIRIIWCPCTVCRPSLQWSIHFRCITYHRAVSIVYKGLCTKLIRLIGLHRIQGGVYVWNYSGAAVTYLLALLLGTWIAQCLREKKVEWFSKSPREILYWIKTKFWRHCFQ